MNKTLKTYATVTLRMEPHDIEVVQIAAAIAGMTVSGYIRDRAVHAATKEVQAQERKS